MKAKLPLILFLVVLASATAAGADLTQIRTLKQGTTRRTATNERGKTSSSHQHSRTHSATRVRHIIEPQRSATQRRSGDEHIRDLSIESRRRSKGGQGGRARMDRLNS
jgi:hypothetical protein